MTLRAQPARPTSPRARSRPVAPVARALGASLLAATLALSTPPPAIAATPSAVAAPGSTERGMWSWPTDVDHAVLTDFTAPATRYGRGHRGVDLAAGEVLLAPADGTVRFAGPVAGRPVLTIDHGAGIVSSYEPVVATVRVGEQVARGAPIGNVIDGHCPTRCVHVGVRDDGEYVSPWRYLGSIARAVLYPTRDAGHDRRARRSDAAVATHIPPSEAAPSIRLWDSSRMPTACTSRRSTSGGNGSSSTTATPRECSL